MRLKDIVTFTAGLNPSRMDSAIPSRCIYSVLSLEEDLHQIEAASSKIETLVGVLSARSGELIVGMMKGRAAIVSGGNSGKFLTSNFAKCSFDHNVIYPWFLVYWFNESDEVTKQNHMAFGRALYSPKALSLLTITLPPYSLQVLIGDIYKNVCRRSYLLEREEQLVKALALGEINQKLKKGFKGD